MIPGPAPSMVRLRLAFLFAERQSCQGIDDRQLLLGGASGSGWLEYKPRAFFNLLGQPFFITTSGVLQNFSTKLKPPINPADL